VSQPSSAPVCVIADTIVRTVELGVTITNAALERDTTVVFCNLITTGPGRCPGCDTVGTYRDTVERRVSDMPVAGHPMQLRVRVPRYRCTDSTCEREVFCHDTDRLAQAGRTTTRRCATYVLRRLIVDRATVASVARELGRSWDTVNGIAVEATTNLLVTNTNRLDGVRVIGVDEHRWAHTRHAAGDGYVTVIVDLTPVVDGTGRARFTRPGPGPLRGRTQKLARRPRHRVPRPRRGGGHGWIRWLQERRHQRITRRDHRDGPVSRRRVGRRQARPVPPARPAGHPGPSRTLR
jgi:hypothetical protein